MTASTGGPDGVVYPGHLQTEGDYFSAEIERLRIEAGLQPRPTPEPVPLSPCDAPHCENVATLSAGAFRRCDRHPPQ